MADRVTIRGVALVAWIAVGSTLSAQQPDYRLEDILTALERGAQRVNLDSANPVAARQLDSVATLLRDAGAGAITVSTMAELIVRKKATVGDVARWDPHAGVLLAQSWFRSAILTLPCVANGDLLQELRSARVPRDTVNAILGPTDALGRRVRELASQQSQEKLRRFEIKYGPESARLNLGEVGLNYLGQWIWPLAPSRDGWPSRYELIAAYRPMELTATKTAGDDVRGTLVSAGQLGLRWYHWRRGWGASGAGRLARVLRPGHASTGVYVLGPRDTPLERPWANGNRLGFFLGWGGMHAAYVVESPRRVLLGSGKQLIPYVF